MFTADFAQLIVVGMCESENEREERGREKEDMGVVLES